MRVGSVHKVNLFTDYLYIIVAKMVSNMKATLL